MKALNLYNKVSLSAVAQLIEQGKNDKVLKELGIDKNNNLKLSVIIKNGKHLVKVEIQNESDYETINSYYKNIDCFDKIVYVSIPLLNKKFKIYTTNNGDDLCIEDILIEYLYTQRTTYKDILYNNCILNEVDISKGYISGGLAGLYVKLKKQDLELDLVLNK